MKSKLDELAAKEAELRRINEALDVKKKKILSEENLEDSKGEDMDELPNPDEKSSENSFD